MPAEVYTREVVHPDDACMVAEEIHKAVASGDPNFNGQAEHRIIRRDVVRKYNTLPEMKMFRDNGGTITYRYRDKEGQLIGDISVGPSDLAK